MKFTKFIPIALAMMLTVPAFATPATTQSSEMTLEVPDFFNITIPSGGNYTSDVTITDDAYTTLEIDTPIVAKFHVVTNKASDAVLLTATAPIEGSATAPAFYANGETLRIVFTNSTATQKATAESVGNITANATPTASSNPNAIAFNITAVPSAVANTGATLGTKVVSDNTIKYPLSNGEYDFQYTLGTTAVPGTFSTMDQSGTYKATITMSRTTP